jgi:hypothetical protein
MQCRAAADHGRAAAAAAAAARRRQCRCDDAVRTCLRGHQFGPHAAGALRMGRPHLPLAGVLMYFDKCWGSAAGA